MFFSRIKIKKDIRHLPDLNCLINGNTYGIHQLLWNLFPGAKERPFIFREEIAGEQLGIRSKARGEPIFYLVSKIKPVEGDSLFKIDCKEYAPKLQNGEDLAFRLRANPVVARPGEGSKNSAKHDVVMDSQKNLLVDLLSLLEMPDTGKKRDLIQRVLQAWEKSNNQKVKDKLEGIIKGHL